MHILTKRQWIDKALKEHQSRFHETPDELVDRLLTGFFCMDAPWSKHGNWMTPLEDHIKRQAAPIKEANGRPLEG